MLADVILVVPLHFTIGKLVKGLQDAVSIHRDNLLLSHAIMAHLQQDQLAIEEEHFATS